MNEHKRAILLAWDAAPLWGHECPRSHEVLGGERAIRQVRAVLRESIEFAKSEAVASVEKDQGREWWDNYIEKPVDDEMRTTLRMAVPRRARETESDYEERLRSIEAALRARLMPFIRNPDLADRRSL